MIERAHYMKKQPKHEQICSELLTEIMSGKYDSSQRLPSESQLVSRFGVSRPTVSRALLDLQRKGVLKRRAGSGTYLSSERPPDQTVRQLGMIVPGLGKIEIFDVVCGELASLARVHSFGMHWGGSSRRPTDVHMGIDEAEELCDRYITTGVCGVFFAPFEHTSDNVAANRRITERLNHAGIPVILLDRDVCAFPDRSDFDIVGIDNFTGGYQLARHVIKLGATRLAFLTRPFSAATVEARRSGVVAAMVDAGLTIAPDFFHTGDCSDVKFLRSLTAGRQFDAVICANDHTAAQLLQCLPRLNTSCPNDIRVVGFDDVRFATLLSVPLTTMHQPCRDIAVVAFHAMRERVADPTLPARSLLLTPRLVIRESCGAYLHR